MIRLRRTARREYGIMTDVIMRVYLDNCCYNRPFDGQSDFRVAIETLAKLLIQSQMRSGVIEYAWSDVLDYEISQSKMLDRARMIWPWKRGAAVYVRSSEEIRVRANEFQAMGVKPFDALHLACAEYADCDWFFTVDRGILKKLSCVGAMRVANPIEYRGGQDEDDD